MGKNTKRKLKKTTKIGLCVIFGTAIIGTAGILTQIGLRYHNEHKASQSDNTSSKNEKTKSANMDKTNTKIK